MPTPNLLAWETTLARLDRVPESAHSLWAKLHRQEGRAISTHRALVTRFQGLYERLGLALVARAQLGDHGPGSLTLRLLTVSLFELLGGVLERAGQLAAELWLEGAPLDLTAKDAARRLRPAAPTLAAHVETRRGALRRIALLAREASDPRRLQLEPPAHTGASPLDADTVEVTAAGVQLAGGPRRSWRPLSEVATEITADTASLLDALARAVEEALSNGLILEYDLVWSP